jgi:hypothetical protein
MEKAKFGIQPATFPKKLDKISTTGHHIENFLNYQFEL